METDAPARSLAPTAPSVAPRSRLLRWWATSLATITLPFLGLVVGRETAIHGDNYAVHVPIFSWVSQSILHGRSPNWAGWYFAGHNVAGMGQGAIYYPVNLAFGLVDEVVAFRWWTLFHLWLAASGAFVWAWRRWGSYPGAAVAAITYGLNGQIVLHLVHANFTIAAAWFPWLLVGLDGLLKSGGLKRWAAYIAPLTMIAFAGHPQVLWGALVTTGIVVLVERGHRGGGLAPWARYAGATAVALGIAAVHLLPQLLFSRTSERPTLSKAQALLHSARLSDLLTAIFPHIEGGGQGVPGMSADYRGNFTYHEVGNFVGIVAALLALVAIVSRFRDRRVASLTVLLVVSIGLAWGENSWFGGLVFDTVPLADRFRIWPRYLIIGNLAVSGLAAAGTAAVLGAPRRWRSTIVSGGLALVVLGPIVVAFGDSLVSGGALVVAIAIPLLAFLALVASTHFADSHRRVATATILLACAVPAILFTLAAPWRSESLSPADAAAFFDPATAAWEPHDAAGGIDRWASRYAIDRGTSIVRDTDRIDGYDPLVQQHVAALTGAGYFGGLVDDRLWTPGWRADVLRITTVTLSRGEDPDNSDWTDTGARTEGGMAIWSYEPKLPEAFVVGEAVLDSFDEIDELLGDPDADFAETVHLEADMPESAPVADGRSTPGVAGTVDSGSMDRHGHGNFVVTADRPAVLVVSTLWLDGWSATVNGRDVPVARANGLVVAVPLEAGVNEIEFSFTPPGLELGAAVTFASLLVLLSVGVVPAVRRRFLGTPVHEPSLTSG